MVHYKATMTKGTLAICGKQNGIIIDNIHSVSCDKCIDAYFRQANELKIKFGKWLKATKADLAILPNNDEEREEDNE